MKKKKILSLASVTSSPPAKHQLATLLDHSYCCINISCVLSSAKNKESIKVRNTLEQLQAGLTWVGVHRRTFKQDSGGAVAQRAVHYVAVTCDPADVGHAAKHVAVLVVEYILRRQEGPLNGMKSNFIKKYLVTLSHFNLTLCQSI